MRFWQDFFTLSRREQTGFFTLLGIVLIIILSFFFDFRREKLGHDPILEEWVDEVNQHVENKEVSVTDLKLFRFNPNIASRSELIQLGFDPHVVSNIIKYRNAGGRINSYSKFASIYGIDSVHLRKVRSYIIFDDDSKKLKKKFKPFVYDFKVDLNTIDSTSMVKWQMDSLVIEDVLRTRKLNYFSQRFGKDSLLSSSMKDWELMKSGKLVAKKTNSTLGDAFVIELNQADTAELAVLRGIGSVLARRIVYYRDRLGGFYNINQLLEVEGISPVVLTDNIAHIKVDGSMLTPLDINVASLRRLKNHPYIDFYMAKEIYEFRKQNGSIASLESVFRLPAFESKDTSLLKLYICIGK